MFELTAAFIAAFSASIFIAHAVEAYLGRLADEPVGNVRRKLPRN